MIKFIKKVEAEDEKIQNAQANPNSTPAKIPSPDLGSNKSGESDYLDEYYEPEEPDYQEKMLGVTQYTYEDDSEDSENERDEVLGLYENSDKNMTGQFRMTGETVNSMIPKSIVRFETISNTDITIENQGTAYNRTKADAAQTQTTYGDKFIDKTKAPRVPSGAKNNIVKNQSDSFEVVGASNPNGKKFLG